MDISPVPDVIPDTANKKDEVVKAPISKPKKSKSGDKSKSKKKKVKTLQEFDIFAATNNDHEIDESVMDEEDLKRVESKDISDEKIGQYVRAFTTAQTERKLGLEMDEVILRDQPQFDKHQESEIEFDKEGLPVMREYDRYDIFFDQFMDNERMSSCFLQLEVLKCGLASCLYYPADK